MRSLIAVAILAGTAGTASAQTFSFGKAEEVKDVATTDWQGTAEGGLVITTGNSRTTTLTAGGKLVRLAEKNKFQGEAGIAYSRARLLIAQDVDMDGDISRTELDYVSTTSANTWFGKLRYDRFLTEKNSLYIAALASRDVPAGKELVGGGQVGYSRQLFKDAKHEMLAEVGYDLSYEDLAVGDPVIIHSARVFAGYTGTLTADTGLTASVEALANVNTLATLPDEAAPLEDTRINGALALTTKLAKVVSFQFSFAVKFDNQPSPLAPFPVPYEAGFTPVAYRTDTLTKASLIFALF